ncbi:MAG: hypothetical protein KGD70_13675 [Candidatus Lokiarchaeota archaeon]|nr:hypothetical protein [Candidatus Lokiarchaeota archaeon]
MLFIIFPSFIGCFSLIVDNFESEPNFVGIRKEVVNEISSKNPQNDRSEIIYKPIETTLNFSRNFERTLDPLGNATNTVEFNLRTGSERVLNKQSSSSRAFQSIVEKLSKLIEK